MMPDFRGLIPFLLFVGALCGVLLYEGCRFVVHHVDVQVHR